MPLGKISKSQIAKGFEALEKIEDALRKNETSKLVELSSLFYTLIPHDFGRQRPPTIADDDTLRKKMDMLLVRKTGLYSDITYCYKIVFGLVTLNVTDFFEFSQFTGTRGHAYKLYKARSDCTVRINFFANSH